MKFSNLIICAILGSLILTGCGSTEIAEATTGAVESTEIETTAMETTAYEASEDDVLVLIESKWSGWGDGITKYNTYAYQEVKVGDIVYETTNDMIPVTFEVAEVTPTSITLKIDGGLVERNEDGSINLNGESLKEITVNKGETIELATKSMDAGKNFTINYYGEHLDYIEAEIESNKETKGEDGEAVIYKKFNEADLNSAPFVVFENVTTFGPIEDGKYDNFHKYKTLSIGDTLYDKYGATVEVMDVSSDVVVLNIKGFEHNNNMENIAEVNLHRGETIELRTDTMDSGAILTIKYNGGIS